MTVILLRILASVFAVVQQPTYLPTFVSVYNVTQFAAVREYGSIGLLAHEGKFPDVIEGNFIAVTLSNGDKVKYAVKEIVRARSLEPRNPYAHFIVGDEELTSTQLAHRVYREGVLTLQTCEGVEGRVFIIAEKRN